MGGFSLLPPKRAEKQQLSGIGESLWKLYDWGGLGLGVGWWLGFTPVDRKPGPRGWALPLRPILPLPQAVFLTLWMKKEKFGGLASWSSSPVPYQSFLPMSLRLCWPRRLTSAPSTDEGWGCPLLLCEAEKCQPE